MEPKRVPNGHQIGPKWLPGGLLELLGRLKASWSAPARALGASTLAFGAPKSTLERLLAAPRRIPRELSAIIGAKRVPKWTPGGCQNGVQNRVWLKMPKS